MSFQRENRQVSIDGVVGPITARNLGWLFVENSFILTRRLRNGLNGNDVRELQRELNRRGIRDRNGRVLKVDGGFGPLTESAVREFQRVNRQASIDGVVGPITATNLGWRFTG